MIHLGYLGYDSEKEKAFIPKKEIVREFENAMSVSGWQEVMRVLKTSEKHKITPVTVFIKLMIAIKYCLGYNRSNQERKSKGAEAMTKIRQDAIKLLEEIPEDKIIFIVQIMQGMKGLYDEEDMSEREEAFKRLEKMKKKVPDLDYDKELALYREEKYGNASAD